MSRRLHQYLLLVPAAALLALASCEARQQAPSAPAPPQAAPSAQADGGVGVSDPAAPEAPALAPELVRAFAELKAAARKRLAADKAAIKNRLGYEKAVERHRRDMAATGMSQRLRPAPLARPHLELALVGPLKRHELRVAELTLGEPEAPSQPVPAEHAGPGPYRYEIDQIIERTPIALAVRPADDEERLERFYRDLTSHPEVLLELVALRIDGDVARFTGYAYALREVTPPKHQTATPSLAELAAAAGVTVPRGHPRIGEVEALLAEHRGLHEDLAASMTALGVAHLLGSVFQFYRGRIEELDGRRFPKPMRGPGP